MFKEIHEVEHNLDGVKEEHTIRLIDVMDILVSQGRKELAEELAQQDSSLFDSVFVKGKLKDGGSVFSQKNKDGELHGKRLELDLDGKLRVFSSWHNDLKEGTTKYYAPDGHLEKEVPYHNGLRNGLEKRYHTDGKTLSKTCEMEDGKLNGLSTHYRRDGSKLSEMKFKDGKPVGLKRIFEKDGKTVAKEVPYTGTIKEFDLNGKKIRETKYVDGVPEIKEEGKLCAILRANSQPAKQTESAQQSVGQSNGQNAMMVKSVMNLKNSGR